MSTSRGLRAYEQSLLMERNIADPETDDDSPQSFAYNYVEGSTFVWWCPFIFHHQPGTSIVTLFLN